jgi:heme-degrading monooxygenase HmoA
MGDLQPGKVDDFFQTFRSDLLPHLKEDPGFKGVRVLVDRGTNKLVTTAMYESEADAKGAEARFQERVGKVRDLLASPPNSAIYEVGVDE